MAAPVALLLLLILSTSVTGCRSTEPAPAPLRPAVTAEGFHFLGTPLSGPVSGELDAPRPDAALQVKVTLAALERLPKDPLDPLESRTRLISVSRGGEPIVPVPRLTRGSRVGFLDAADPFLDHLARGKLGRSEVVGECRGALPPGVTVVHRTTEEGTSSGESVDGSRRVEIEVFRGPGEAAGLAAGGVLQVVLSVEDWVWLDEERRDRKESGEDATTDEGTSQPPAPSATRLVLQKEVVLLDTLSVSSPRAIVLLFPSRFRSSPAQALAAVVQVGPAPGEGEAGVVEHASALDRCVADLRRASVAVRNRLAVAPVDPPVWPGLASGLEGLDSTATRRGALVFLANATGARLAEDIALAASEDVVARLTEAFLKARDSIEERRALAWALEHAAFQLAAELLSSGDLPTDLEGVLAHHAGEVGRNASILEEVVAGASDAEDLRFRFDNENLIYLEDSSPAARARAFEWLSARSRAPAGYDPLAPVKHRRAALARASETADKVEGVAP